MIDRRSVWVAVVCVEQQWAFAVFAAVACSIAKAGAERWCGSGAALPRAHALIVAFGADVVVTSGFCSRVSDPERRSA